MAEITISGSADELSTAVQSVAERERSERQEAEQEAAKYAAEQEEAQAEMAEEQAEVLAEELEREGEDELAANDELIAALNGLGDRLEAKFESLRNPDDVARERRAELRRQLEELGPDPDEVTDEASASATEGSERVPTAPPRKQSARKPDTVSERKEVEGGSSEKGGEQKRRRGGWFA